MPGHLPLRDQMLTTCLQQLFIPFNTFCKAPPKLEGNADEVPAVAVGPCPRADDGGAAPKMLVFTVGMEVALFRSSPAPNVNPPDGALVILFASIWVGAPNRGVPNAKDAKVEAAGFGAAPGLVFPQATHWSQSSTLLTKHSAHDHPFGLLAQMLLKLEGVPANWTRY